MKANIPGNWPYSKWIIHIRACVVTSDSLQPDNCSLHVSSAYGIFKARILEWVVIFSSRASSQPRDRTCVSCISIIVWCILYHWATWEAPTTCYVRLGCMLSWFSHIWLFVTPWTIAHQAPLSMGFSRQEYWSWLPFPTLGDLSNARIEPATLICPTLAGRFFTTSANWEAHIKLNVILRKNTTIQIANWSLLGISEDFRKFYEYPLVIQLHKSDTWRNTHNQEKVSSET